MPHRQQTIRHFSLALSGGGARGAMHVGVLEALTERGFRPSRLSGCSFGSLVAVTYAAGGDWRSIPVRVRDAFAMRAMRPAYSKMGLLSVGVVERWVSRLCPVERLEDLPVPVTVCTTDLLTGQPVYFNEGPLAKLVAASCLLPALFVPMEYEGYQLVDGGVTDNLPITPLLGHGHPVWASHTNAYPSGVAAGTGRHVLERCGQLLIGRQAQAQRHHCQVWIEDTDVGQYRLLDWSASPTMARLGYRAALEAINSQHLSPADSPQTAGPTYY